MSTFTRDNKNGKAGEEKFVDFIKSLNRYDIKDTTSNKEYYGKDIDYVLYNKRKKTTLTFEVKTDYKDCDKNVLIEYVSNATTNRPGWGLASWADKIAIFKTPNLVFWILDGKRLRQFIKEQTKLDADDWTRCETKEGYTYDTNGDLMYKSLNFCIPRQILIDKHIIICKCALNIVKNTWEHKELIA